MAKDSVKQTNKKLKSNLPEKYLKEGGPGRPKGSKDKFTELKDAFLEAFDRLGSVDGLVEWALLNNNNKGQFYQMITKLLPKSVSIDTPGDITFIIPREYKPKAEGKRE